MGKYSLDANAIYPIIVEPAASDRSTCKACNKKIAKSELRAEGVDVSQRLADLAEQGSDLDYGSGSDGYGIKKFWVHLNCFDAAVHSNKYLYEKQYFKCQKFKGDNKAKFDAWLAWRATGHKGAPAEAPTAITAQLAAPAAAGAPAEAKEEKKQGKGRKADDSDEAEKPKAKKKRGGKK